MDKKKKSITIKISESDYEKVKNLADSRRMDLTEYSKKMILFETRTNYQAEIARMRTYAEIDYFKKSNFNKTKKFDITEIPKSFIKSFRLYWGIWGLYLGLYNNIEKSYSRTTAKTNEITSAIIKKELPSEDVDNFHVWSDLLRAYIKTELLKN